MSQTTVETARTFTDAFNAHDVEALISCCDPSIEFHSTFAAVGGAVYHEHDGLYGRQERTSLASWAFLARAEIPMT